MVGHEDMINYLSLYRTQDTFKGKHYYPSGALCWFECNQYGDPLGPVYYIKRIPDLKMLEQSRYDRGYKKLIKEKQKKLTLKEVLSKECLDVVPINTDIMKRKE